MAIPLIAAIGAGLRLAAPAVLRAFAPQAARTAATSTARLIPTTGSSFIRSTLPSTVRSTAPAFRYSAPMGTSASSAGFRTVVNANRAVSPTIIRQASATPTPNLFIRAARTSVAPRLTNITKALRSGNAGPGEAADELAFLLSGANNAAAAARAASLGSAVRGGLITSREATSGLLRIASSARTAAPSTFRTSSSTSGNIASGASKANLRVPTSPAGGPPPVPPTGAASEASRGFLSRALRATPRFAAEGALFASPTIINAAEEQTGYDVPDWLEAALGLAGAGVSAKFGLKGAQGAFKGLRGQGVKSKLGGAVQGAVGAGGLYGAYTLGSGALQTLTQGDMSQQAVAEEPQAMPGVTIPEGGVVGPGAGQAPPPAGTPEAEAETQLEAIDAAFQAAVDEIMESYGGVEEALRALDAGDPALAQTLASLDSQYRQAQSAVAAEYSAAVGDIAGYQQQVDSLMQEVAAQQAADFEAAAGGLENIDVGVDPATAAMAAEAGVSDTAVGGGAITGAGLSRGLAGAAAAEGAASRIRTGSELAGLVASTRQDAAAQQAALSQQYLSQRYAAEVAAAESEAARRQAIEDALIQNESEMRQALSQINLQKAQQLGQLSPQDFAAASGQNRQLPVPQWFGGKLQGDFTSPVAGGPTKIVKNEVGQEQEVPATVGDVNGLLDQLYSVSSGARQLYSEGRTSDAYGYLAEFYSKVPMTDWFYYLGMPTTAYDAYVDLFGQPPS